MDKENLSSVYRRASVNLMPYDVAHFFLLIFYFAQNLCEQRVLFAFRLKECFGEFSIFCRQTGVFLYDFGKLIQRVNGVAQEGKKLFGGRLHVTLKRRVF